MIYFKFFKNANGGKDNKKLLGGRWQVCLEMHPHKEIYDFRFTIYDFRF